MPKQSAGLLAFRLTGGEVQLLLVHPGGPYWKNKDDGAWTIPKGELHPGEDPLAAAQREFAEETGWAPAGPFVPLGSVRQPGGKIVHAWACAGNFDPATLRSNLFEAEWPPRSGRQASFPEVDRAAWFSAAAAETKISPGLRPLVAQLRAALDSQSPTSGP